ncbi:MAG: hypothetical protein KatS3mg111_1280 [Pirellulaceae bacterium]|nr:MAG: hypothetical protein KatS3mg111_1280 [Pirellulaceae bacterium]
MECKDRYKPYRCFVPLESSAGVLHVGRFTIAIRVREVSRTEFVVSVPLDQVGRLDRSRAIYLDFHGERWLVRKTSEYHGDEVAAWVTLERLQDATRHRVPRSWAATLKPRRETDSDPVLLAGLCVCLAIMFLVFPGVGDKLGTKQLLVSSLRSVWQAVISVFW